jgi:hypothetical protein
VPALFVCHDRLARTDVPPPLARIRRHVAVDENCRERLLLFGVTADRLSVVPNAVDLRRFTPRLPLPDRPARALVFSSYARPGAHLDAVQAACDRVGLPLDVVGSAMGSLVAAPEEMLGRYDLVVAKGRAALEAMAVGAAVVLCDFQGLGPLVSADNVAVLRPWNFGMRLLTEPLQPARIAERMAAYDPADAAAVRDYIRRDASLDAALDRYQALHREVLADPGPDVSSADELRDYLTRLLDQLTTVEDVPPRYSMPRLPPDERSALTVSVESAPRDLAQSATAWVRVLVRNGSSRWINSGPPFPLNLSYRWEDEAGALVVREGRRTALPRPLGPDEVGELALSVEAPGQPGPHRLRVTLVQEHVAWLDDGPSPVSDSAWVTVV